MIYASAVLHNLCTVHARDGLDFAVGASTEWARFFEMYKAHLCPSCKRRKVGHCVHQSAYRNSYQQHAAARTAPSQLRDELRSQLWAAVCDGSGVGLSDEDLELASAENLSTHAEVERIRNEMVVRSNRARQGGLGVDWAGALS